jgi:N-acetylmuramoyl-L-alanine amidase
MRPTAQRLLLVALAVAPARAPGEPRPVLRVVVDAGHGGSNLGAPGHVAGVFEKQLTLAVARVLRGRLERDGISVVFTRDADAYLTLSERVRRANTALATGGADLFVSLHANASPDHRSRGVESFVLARAARDVEAHRSGAVAVESGDVGDALLARARVRQLAVESARLARAVQSRLAPSAVSDRGIHQAPFDVLEGLRMPAVLVEMGFIDHPVEGVELLEAETIRRLADAIADGIEDYSAGRKQTLAAAD